MILLDIEAPKSCFDCRFRTATGECELTGFYTSHKAYVMPLSYDCPIKAEIPKNATNGDVMMAVFKEVRHYSDGKICAEWWNAPWKGLVQHD